MKKNCVIEQRQSLVTDVPRLSMCHVAPGAAATRSRCRPPLRSASCPNLGEEPLETLLRTRSRSTPNISTANNYMASPPMFPNYCAPPPVSVNPYYTANRRARSHTNHATARTGRVQPPAWIKEIASCGVCPGPCAPCGPCGGCCPCPGTPAGGCALPPPCNTPPKCIQYMNGYYYYPYGFWFCGPYHVSGTCVPGGPVQAGCCGPCGPAPPCPGGPCGPACIGPCCMATDLASLLSESPYRATLQSAVDQLPKVENLIPPMGLLAVLMKHGSKGMKTDTYSKDAENCKGFREISKAAPERPQEHFCNALVDSPKIEQTQVRTEDSKPDEETRIYATLGVVDPVTTAAATLACGCGCGCPSGIAPRPCGCGCPWPGGCAPPGCASCGPCCGPCGCGPCGFGCGPCGCGPCGCGPCGPCGSCGPCGPCGCGPCGPCGCGPCGPPCPSCRCGPCCCGVFAGPCVNVKCATPMPVCCTAVFEDTGLEKKEASPPVDQLEQYHYTPCPVNLTPKPLPSSSRFVINPNLARNHPFNQVRYCGKMPLFENFVKHLTMGHILCAPAKICPLEQTKVFSSVTADPRESAALYECCSESEVFHDAQDEVEEKCDLGGMKYRRVQPTFSTEAVVIRRVGNSFRWSSPLK